MLLGFKKRFVEPIQIGTKVFTCRKKRKTEPKIGETIHMYTCLRTANCSRISNKEKLISTQEVVVDIIVTKLKDKWAFKPDGRINIKVDGRFLSDSEKEQFVKFDGFTSIDDFISYWCADMPKPDFDYNPTLPVIFRNELVMFHWTDLRY
jgi:hypothetical protein